MTEPTLSAIPASGATPSASPAAAAGAAPVIGLGSERTSVLIVWGLYLGNLVLPILSIVGLVMAYIWRGDSTSDAAKSHYSKAIALFWQALIVGIIGFVLSAFLIGIPILIAVAIWFLVVSIKGVIRAADNKPYA